MRRSALDQKARPVTWFSITLSLTMALLTLYLPYQFQTPQYQYIYPYLRLFGLAFGLAFVLLAAVELDVGLPRWWAHAGKSSLMLAGVAILFGVAVPFNLVTRIVFYGALALVLIISILAPSRETEAFYGFYLAVLVLTGFALLLRQGGSPYSFQAGRPWLGLLLTGAGLLLGAAGPYLKGREWVWLLASAPLAAVAWNWAAVDEWTGVGVYATLAVAGVGWALYQQLPWSIPVRGLRRRILAMAIALSVLPTLALGAAAVAGVERLNQEKALERLELTRLQAERELERVLAAGGVREPESLTEMLAEALPWQEGTAPAIYPLGQEPAHWQAGEAALEQPTALGRRTYVSYVKRADLGLVVAVLEEAGAAHSGAEQVSVWLLVGTLLVAGVAIALSVPVSERLTYRLEQIRTVAAAVGEQHFEVRVPSHPVDDEVAILAGTVNEMAATLGLYHREIEAQSKKLRHQYEELAAQAEELAAQAEELSDQNHLLQMQGQELRLRAEQQEAVAGIGQLALAGAGPEELARETVAQVARALGVDSVAIWELQRDGKTLLLKAAVGLPEEMAGRLRLTEETHAAAFRTMQERDPVIVDDLSADARFACLCQVLESGIKSGISVTIHDRQRPYGALSAHTVRPRSFSKEHALFLQSVANGLAVAIERHRTGRYAAAQHAVTGILADSSLFSEAAPRVLEAICRQLGWDVGALWTTDQERRLLRLDQIWAAPDVSLPLFEAEVPGVTFRRGEGLPGRVWAEGQPIWAEDVSTDPRFSRAPLAIRENLHGAVFFPIKLDGEVVGLMEFFCREVRQRDDELLRLMNGFGNQLSQFLARKRSEEERARLLVRERQARLSAEAAADQVRRLQRITDAMLAHLSVQDLLGEMLQRLKDALRADTVSILLLNAERTHLDMAACVGLPEGFCQDLRLPVGSGFSGRVAALGKAWVVDDVTTLEDMRADWKGLIRSAAGMPLIVEDRVTGVVFAGSFTPRHFLPEDERLLQLAADRLALAIDHAHLYEAEVKARKDLETKSREIQELNAELEERVAQRTAQLETAVRELEAFSYSVSHDLRAPLRTVDGFSQILLEEYADTLDPLGQDYLRRVRQASQRMGQLIDALLQLSRVSRSEMQMDTVDLSATAGAILADLQRMEPTRQVRTQVADGLIVRGDPRLIRVVLENLLGNAWKFTARTADARIQLGRLQTDGNQALFVRDNGVGFNMTYAEKLFTPFHRLHSEREYPGTGIGLATVQRIIKRHGGRIWAEAAPNQGATFYFTL